MANFWARFARRSTRSGDAILLENYFLPLLEANAAYGDSTLGQPILIRSSAGERLEGFDLAGTLIALEVLAVASDPSIWIEQVAWTQAPRLARVWCDQNDASDWLAFVAQELARSLETQPDLLAYLAYSGDEAAGMMIASSDGICGLWAGTDEVARALFARGRSDLGRLAVSVPLERRGACGMCNETARFEIWLNRHQPSDAQTQPLPDP